MMLADLREFLLFNSGATLSIIAKHFSMKSLDMQFILEHWVKKGRLSYQACNACSSDCSDCPLLDLRGKYYWVV